MQEETQQNPTAPAQASYDARSENRFEYDIERDGLTYSVAHVFGPLSDDRYLQWLGELNIRGEDEEISETAREASVKLWDELIVRLEGVEFDEGLNWKEYIPASEKIAAINDLFAVAINTAQKKAAGKLRLDPNADSNVVIRTEAYRNGEILIQTHTLRQPTFEDEKNYSRIQARRIRTEQTRGLRRKPKVEYVPQDARIGELYDSLVISTEGFAGEIPLRFKTTVVHYLLGKELEVKSLGK
ncbi:MAG: hypothetical protein KF831_10385 [Acidobacteria bacterium]|nr:hypothetical protein [Acidobacteriota bacterium]